MLALRNNVHCALFSEEIRDGRASEDNVSYRLSKGPASIPRRRVLSFLILLCALLPTVLRAQGASASDPLPSWNDGPTKKAILAFVEKTTTPNAPGFLGVDERVITFDNDGTLWVEQPMYTQLAFALDRVKQLAPQHPEWKTEQPFQGVLEGDMKAVGATGEMGLMKLMMASHAGMTTDEFQKIVVDWMATHQHPRFKRPYTECVYQPMLELLSYLRANGFKTFIVSGGGVEFMRPWSQKVYGIPPNQVVGSSIKTQFELRDGQPVLMRLAELEFIDDGPGKPVGINRFIGIHPVGAVGNSDGDQQMLEWAASGSGPRLLLLVHHTDAEREYAYDKPSRVGQLDKALTEANAKGWTVIDMKRDWKTVFPPEH
jgi:hypothetical protein